MYFVILSIVVKINKIFLVPHLEKKEKIAFYK